MSDKPISLSNNSRSDDCALVRVEVSSNLSHSHLIINQLAHEVIPITYDSDSKRFSRGSSNGGDFSNDFSFDTLFFDNDVEGDRTVHSMLY